MSKYNYNKLRGKITEKYGSQANFARALGLSEVSVSNKLTLKNGFSQDDIIKWSALLDIDSNEYGTYFFNTVLNVV